MMIQVNTGNTTSASSSHIYFHYTSHVIAVFDLDYYLER